MSVMSLSTLLPATRYANITSVRCGQQLKRSDDPMDNKFHLGKRNEFINSCLESEQNTQESNVVYMFLILHQYRILVKGSVTRLL